MAERIKLSDFEEKVLNSSVPVLVDKENKNQIEIDGKKWNGLKLFSSGVEF